MPKIDKREFADFCLKHAARFGANFHYIVAVAELRSGISDKATNGSVGPFGYTPDEWESAIKRSASDDAYGAGGVTSRHFRTQDIGSWRAQCEVFAAATGKTVWQLTETLSRSPEAAEIYCAQFAINPSEFESLAKQIEEAIDATALFASEVVYSKSRSQLKRLQASAPEGPAIELHTPRRDSRAYQSKHPEGVKSGQYKVWFGTNRKPVDPLHLEKGFSSEPDSKVHLGYCTVFVPASHIIGHLGSPWYCRLLRGSDDRLKLLSTAALETSEFWRGVTGVWGDLDEWDRSALIFVHGYNVDFAGAALRAAQIGFDLSINGAMAFYSWPSQGEMAGYPVDEATIEASEMQITDFMVDFAEKSGADKVHIIAHSMGNRGVLRAVNRIAGRAQGATGRLFGQIALAAADVHSDTFRSLCSSFGKVAERTTLYVSEGDLAIGASRWLHKFPRVGLRPPIFLAPHIDTVDVTQVNLSFLGHGYVAEERTVLQDMYLLIKNGLPPTRRFGLQQECSEAGEVYWSIGR